MLELSICWRRLNVGALDCWRRMLELGFVGGDLHVGALSCRRRLDWNFEFFGGDVGVGALKGFPGSFFREANCLGWLGSIQHYYKVAWQ